MIQPKWWKGVVEVGVRRRSGPLFPIQCVHTIYSNEALPRHPPFILKRS